MSAGAILARARAAGLVVTASGDRLRWRGPRPSAELMDALRQHKAELLHILTLASAVELARAPSITAAPLAAQALAAAAEHGAAAGGPVDDLEAAEAVAIRDDEGISAQCAHARELIRPFLMAALYRAPYWPDTVGHPVTPGAFCGVCHGRVWWWGADTTAPRSDWRLPGWHCARCHPPAEDAAQRQMRTGEDAEPPGPHQRAALQ